MKLILGLLLLTPCSNFFSQAFIENANLKGVDHLHVEPQIMGGGAAFFDFNNDGFDDLYLTSGNGMDQLYKNNQDGTFTEIAALAGLTNTSLSNTVGVATGDINNDGYRDIFITTDKFSHNLLYKNNGDGTFSDISLLAGITDTAWGASISFGDYNLDGFLDIYVSNYCEFPYTQGIPFYLTTISGVDNYFYINNGNETFTQKATQLGVQDNGTALSVCFTDFDNDGDVDIYLGNDFGLDFNRNQLFENLYPIDSFANISNSSGTDLGIYTMGTAIGDYDEDGELDYYVSNMFQNVLLHNNGNKTFIDVAATQNIEAVSGVSWGGFFFDFNNDSFLDIFVSSGQMVFSNPNQYQINHLYKNNAGTIYNDVSLIEGLADSSRSRGTAFSDFDNDGDLDFVIVNVNVDSSTTKRTWFMENQQTGIGNWLKIDLSGTVNNKDAFGSHVEVYSNGRRFLREVDGGSGYLSHNSSILHFGIGSATTIDSVVVYWLGGGVQVEYPIGVNQLLSITERATNHQYICFGDSLFLGGTFRLKSGSYNDTIVLPFFIDSIYMTVLHISDSIYLKNRSICSGDSILLGGGYQLFSGLYYDTLLSVRNCDSIIQTNLTILSPINITTSSNICNGDSLLLHGIYQSTAGNYVGIYSTIMGCDSTVTTSLNIIPTDTITNNTTICSGDSSLINGVYQNVAGTYTSLYSSLQGCDSLVYTTLMIVSPLVVQNYFSICNGDSLLLNGIYYSSDTAYSTNYSTILGCDSIVQTSIVLLPTYDINNTVSICEGDSALIFGSYETNGNTYSNLFFSVYGCDSLVSTNLTILNTDSIVIDATINLGDSIYLAGTYQYTTGLYVDTLYNVAGCDSLIMTNLLVQTISGISTRDNNKFSIFPNPSNGIFIIEKNEEISKTRVVIYNFIGQKIYDQEINFTNNKNQLNLSYLAKGVYQVLIGNSVKREVHNIVLE